MPVSAPVGVSVPPIETLFPNGRRTGGGSPHDAVREPRSVDYQTLDVVRALAASGRQSEVSLYTGNDENIVADLMTEYRVPGKNGTVPIRLC